MTGFGLDPDWLTEQLRSCSAIQKPIFKYVAKNDTFLPVAFADGLEEWVVQLGCLCLLEAVEAGWVVLAEAFEEEGWVEWEPGSVGL